MSTFKIILTIGVLFLFCPVSGCLILQMAASHRLATELSQLEEANEPLTFAQLRARQPNIPQELNSYVALMPVFERAESIGELGFRDAERTKRLPIIGDANFKWPEMWDLSSASAVHTFLDEHSILITDLGSASELQRGTVYLDVSLENTNTLTESMLPTTQGLRSAMKIMSLQTLSCAYVADFQQAYDAWIDVLSLSRALDETPNLIIALSGAGCDSMSTALIRDLLTIDMNISASQLANIQSVLARRVDEVSPRIATALRGERVYVHQLIELIRAAKIDTLDQQQRESFQKLNNTPFAIIADFDQAYALGMMSWLVELVENPNEYDVRALHHWESERTETPSYYPISNTILPSLDRMVLLSWRARTELICAQVGVAAERFRRERSRWPETLAELVPKYLNQVPVDPYSGELLEYRIKNDHVVIYSVGADGVDDQGSAEVNQETKLPSDIGFRLLNADKRHAPFSEELLTGSLTPDSG